MPARWDASQIYGDEKFHAESLRVEGKAGRLCEMRLDENGNLPIDPATGLPEGGAARRRLLYACISPQDRAQISLDACPALCHSSLLSHTQLLYCKRRVKSFVLHARMKHMPHEVSLHARPAAAGMIKNWWAGVEALHNLFVKEHNYICGMLREVASMLLSAAAAPENFGAILGRCPGCLHGREGTSRFVQLRIQ